MRRPCHEHALTCGVNDLSFVCGNGFQELSRFFGNEVLDDASVRSLIAAFIDPDLRLDGDCLVGGQGVDGEETAGVSGQSIDGNHADPLIDVVE